MDEKPLLTYVSLFLNVLSRAPGRHVVSHMERARSEKAPRADKALALVRSRAEKITSNSTMQPILRSPALIRRTNVYFVFYSFSRAWRNAVSAWKTRSRIILNNCDFQYSSCEWNVILFCERVSEENYNSLIRPSFQQNRIAYCENWKEKIVHADMDCKFIFYFANISSKDHTSARIINVL